MSNRRELRWPNVQTNGTAKNFAGWNASQLPVEIPPASQSDLLTGSNDTNPLTVAGIQSVRSLIRTPVSVSAGILTLDLGLARERKFEDSSISSSSFAIQFAQDANAEIFTLSKRITGTVVVTLPSVCVMEEAELRFVNGTKLLTLTGGTGSYFIFSFYRITSSLYEVRVTAKIYTA